MKVLLLLLQAVSCLGTDKTVCCIGAGYVGGTTCAVIADNNPDKKVYVVDVNAERISQWNGETLPIYEQGLKEIVEKTRNKNLFFTTDFAKAIKESMFVFLCVNTPTKDYGLGEGMAYDLSYTEGAVREILKYARGKKIIIEKSTVPCKTAEKIQDLIAKQGARGLQAEILSNPEFLAQGCAVEGLQKPARVLIGCFPTQKGEKAQKELKELYQTWVPEEKVVTTDVWTSELAKLASNAFLAQRVSSINALSELCEHVGADVGQLSGIIGRDPRIGSGFLQSGLGFGGSCFEKDLRCLIYLSDYFGLKDVSKYWQAVIDMNTHQKHRMVKKMSERMFSSLAGKKIAVLGFAFKKDTSDTRKTPAASVVEDLVKENAHVGIYDPIVSMEAMEGELVIPEHKKHLVTKEKSAYEASHGADAVVVCTDWDEFADLDFGRIYQNMNKPAFLFDGKNMLDRKALHSIGYEIYSIGHS